MKTTECQNGEFLTVISEGYNAAGEMSVHGSALEAWVFTKWGKKIYIILTHGIYNTRPT